MTAILIAFLRIYSYNLLEISSIKRKADFTERRSLFSLRGTCFGIYFYKEKRSKFEWGDICEKGDILG